MDDKVLVGIHANEPDHDLGDAGLGPHQPDHELGLEPLHPPEDLVTAGGAPAVEAARTGLEPHQPDHELGDAGLESHQSDEDLVAAGGFPAVAAARPAGRGAAKRSEKWPQGSSSTPWQLAPILSGGRQTGWGAT